MISIATVMIAANAAAMTRARGSRIATWLTDR